MSEDKVENKFFFFGVEKKAGDFGCFQYYSDQSQSEDDVRKCISEKYDIVGGGFSHEGGIGKMLNAELEWLAEK